MSFYRYAMCRAAINLFWLSSITAFMAFANGQDVLDLGDLGQYDGRLEPPVLNGSTVWISASEPGDFDIALSRETENKVREVLNACGPDMDTQCYNEVHNTLKVSELQVDHQLNRRHFGHMLFKTFGRGGAGAILAFITEILMSNWHLRHADEEFARKFLNHNQASKASIMATATKVVVSADGQPIATHTPTPHVATLQGSETPSITLMTSAEAPFQSGDLAAILDGDLATRLDEIMHRTTNCEDGISFDRGTLFKRQGSAATLGNVVCAAEGALIMAKEAGPLNDLLLLDISKIHISFPAAAGEVARAAAVAKDFVLIYAPTIPLPEEVAIQLSNVLILLAIETLINKIPLNTRNQIPITIVTTSIPDSSATTTATSSGCPNPTSSPLACGFEEKNDCDVEMPKIKSEQPKCKSYGGCQCLTPADTYYNMASIEEQKAMILISDLVRNAEPTLPRPTAVCDMKRLSKIPGNVFNGPSNNIFHDFCDKWAPDSSLRLAADARGFERSPKKTSWISRRTPPADPDLYMDYSFYLSFEPTKKDKKCMKRCTDAMKQLGNACSNSGAMNHEMQESGFIDVDCGIFEYTIISTLPQPPTPPTPPTTPLALQKRQCYGRDEFGKHRDIHQNNVWWGSIRACIKVDGKPIKHGDASTNLAYSDYDGRQPVQFNIYWKEGCLLENLEVDEMNPINPLGVEKVGNSYCPYLFYDNWRNCNNGGVGGSIQAGCLVYEFKATHD